VPTAWAQRIDELSERYHAGEPVRDDLIAAGYPLVRAIICQRGWFAPGYELDDLTQEGMIGYTEAVDSWRPDVVRLFRSWAAFCIRRELIAVLKAANRVKHSFLNDAASLDAPAPWADKRPLALIDLVEADDGDPEEYLLRQEEIHETRLLLLGVCQGMSALERDALLRVTDGQSYVEIARALGKTPKAIDNAIWRARRKLNRRREAMSA